MTSIYFYLVLVFPVYLELHILSLLFSINISTIHVPRPVNRTGREELARFTFWRPNVGLFVEIKLEIYFLGKGDLALTTL